MNPIIRAARIAHAAHEGQVRKYTNRPYIVHPGRCAARASYLVASDEILVAGLWCHDVLEDAHPSYGEAIALYLGDEIAALVAELTNPSKQHPELPRAERKAMDLGHIRGASLRARRAKLIDRTDNLLDMTGAPLSDIARYVPESERLLEALSGTHAELEAEFAAALVPLRQRLCCAEADTRVLACVASPTPRR